MRVLRAPSDEDEVAAFETDVLAGFVLARASAGLAAYLQVLELRHRPGSAT